MPKIIFLKYFPSQSVKTPGDFIYFYKPCWNINLDTSYNLWSLLAHLKFLYKIFSFFSQSIRMSRKNVNFGDNKILKSDFYKNKKVSRINDIDANKTLVSKEEPYRTKKSFKYFIEYNDNDVIRPLYIELTKMTGYVRKSVIKAKKEYYPPTLLEECKYVQEKIKMENLIDDDCEKSLSDESNSQSDKDNDESNE